MSESNSAPETFQISIEAAEFYEAAFVPAFFAQWAPTLCTEAGVAPGQRVLDVACGTGIAARTAADLVEPGGEVVGVDLNEAMLSVARRVRPDVDWRQGDADELPFPDEAFDTVLCQMALIFFPDRPAAVAEMVRVLRVGGTLAAMVPARLDGQDAFGPFVDMAARRAGPDAVSLLSTYFVCGDLDELTSLIESAGLRVTTSSTIRGTYRAPSVDGFVTTEVESTPLRERITDDVYEQIRRDAHDVLKPFTAADGSVEAPFDCNLVTAHRP